jgi:hypothetical protein
MIQWINFNKEAEQNNVGDIFSPWMVHHAAFIDASASLSLFADCGEGDAGVDMVEYCVYEGLHFCCCWASCWYLGKPVNLNFVTCSLALSVMITSERNASLMALRIWKWP